ncbi:MAG: hypothetical protein GXO54_06495 [Chloroflexi bacterium]|nr:hypothetical protein [Chloroflexota bacterium]
MNPAPSQERLAGIGPWARVYQRYYAATEQTQRYKVLHLSGPLQTLEPAMRAALREALARYGQIPPTRGLMPLHDAGMTDEGRVYTLAPWYPKTLNDWLGDATDEVVLHWVLRLGDGLLVLHERGWAHGGVVPSNALLDARGDVALADFGWSWAAFHGHTLDPLRVPLSRRGFIPPEMWRGEVTPASDVFMLASSLIALLRGVPPWVGPPEPFAIDHVPSAWADVVMPALASEADQRPSLAAWLEQLRAWGRTRGWLPREAHLTSLSSSDVVDPVPPGEPEATPLGMGSVPPGGPGVTPPGMGSVPPGGPGVTPPGMGSVPPGGPGAAPPGMGSVPPGGPGAAPPRGRPWWYYALWALAFLFLGFTCGALGCFTIFAIIGETADDATLAESVTLAPESTPTFTPRPRASTPSSMPTVTLAASPSISRPPDIPTTWRLWLADDFTDPTPRWRSLVISNEGDVVDIIKTPPEDGIYTLTLEDTETSIWAEPQDARWPTAGIVEVRLRVRPPGVIRDWVGIAWLCEFRSPDMGLISLSLDPPDTAEIALWTDIDSEDPEVDRLATLPASVREALNAGNWVNVRVAYNVPSEPEGYVWGVYVEDEPIVTTSTEDLFFEDPGDCWLVLASDTVSPVFLDMDYFRLWGPSEPEP